MSKLLDYLNTLDKDAAAREAHVNDPKGTMDQFGLSEEEQNVFTSGDKAKLAQHIGINEDDLPSIQVTETTYE
ncbi:hypothetical protein ACO0K3_17695 [Undibacterium sp. Rencai35W]|uniref:hypothetical protein n=1 Tax=Undibacterium sp. Rencai35W TaxID=3413046 RepID=UPI003BF3D7ED